MWSFRLLFVIAALLCFDKKFLYFTGRESIVCPGSCERKDYIYYPAKRKAVTALVRLYLQSRTLYSTIVRVAVTACHINSI